MALGRPDTHAYTQSKPLQLKNTQSHISNGLDLDSFFSFLALFFISCFGGVLLPLPFMKLLKWFRDRFYERFVDTPQ